MIQNVVDGSISDATNPELVWLVLSYTIFLNNFEDVWVGASAKMDLEYPVNPPAFLNSCSCHDNSLEKWFQVVVQ